MSVIASIATLDASDNDNWDAFIKNHPDASHYHLSAWKKLIEHVFRHQCHYYYAYNQDKEILGVLPLVRLKSFLFGDYMVSMPFFNYGGAIAVNDSIEAELMQKVVESFSDQGISHIEFRDIKSRAGYQVKTEKVSMRLELPDNEEVLWKALGAKRRAQIKRPLREDPEIKEGGVELLNDFYNVFSRNMRDLGTPVYSKYFFRKILEAFPEQSKLIIIYIRKRPVGAAYLLGFKDNLEIPWASTIREVNSIGVNMLMYWEVLRFAIRNQFKVFDFGRSSVDSGTYRFKKQWGATPHQSYWHYWLPEDALLPQLNPSNTKYKMAIDLWKRMPLPFTRLVGPHIVKNLP